MKIHNCEQYSEEWWAVRKNRLTASIASKVLTPTGRKSTQYIPEMARIIAEGMGWQEPAPRVETYWMARGSDMEAQARNWLSLELDETVEEVGFISEGDYLGCSPDGIIKLDHFTNRGGHPDWKTTIPAELKCPMPSTHIKWLLADELPSEHKAQLHFAMVITRAPYGYFMSYHPECEPLLLKVERDDYTMKMYAAIQEYIVAFESAYKRITGRDYGSE